MVDAGFEDAEHFECYQVYRVNFEAAARGHSRDPHINDTEVSIDIPECSEIRSQSRGEQTCPSAGVEILAEFWVREGLVESGEEDALKLALLHLRDIESHL